jgi:hypothetical protein
VVGAFLLCAWIGADRASAHRLSASDAELEALNSIRGMRFHFFERYEDQWDPVSERPIDSVKQFEDGGDWLVARCAPGERFRRKGRWHRHARTCPLRVFAPWVHFVEVPPPADAAELAPEEPYFAEVIERGFQCQGDLVVRYRSAGVLPDENGDYWTFRNRERNLSCDFITLDALSGLHERSLSKYGQFTLP